MTIPTVNKLFLGNDTFQNTARPGHIRRLSYFPLRLPRAIFENITVTMPEELLETPSTPAPSVYFRFVDEASWLAAARSAGFITTVVDDEGVEFARKDYTAAHAIDVIGLISEGGEWDEDGNEIIPPTVLPG